MQLTATADFDVIPCGSTMAFVPLSTEAVNWLDDNVQAEPWQWLGCALHVDSRSAVTLLEGILAEGFVIE